MAAGTYDITIEQGATFTLNLRWLDSEGTPIDITGYTARMQVRRKYSDKTSVLSLTSQDNEIILGDSLGTIDVTASDEKTAAINIKAGVYDLELETPSGDVVRLVQGTAVISPEATK